MLAADCGARFLIIGKAFVFKYLREDNCTMTGICALPANTRAPVDGAKRMDAGSADD
jgi:hypothetical protein